ncbi:fungal-specific transcription factor domain-containing protein [Aspergillus pseudoustus]|uniref:Fungal-specific transcription factor domain-containing protein n=1 Tax=Aspergillus pseudoustus TaxID=1810923 RepID=A0ABR4JRM6_9EURO
MSSHSLRSAIRPRRHNKTFTGCWTCRARKVKCDEERPGCRQCSQRRIECAGYGVRLQWLAPGTGGGDDQDRCEPLYQNESRRRRIVPCSESESAPLSYQVDSALVAIDAIKPGQLKNQGNENESLTFIGGFGVFDLSKSNFGHADTQLEVDVAESPITGDQTTPPTQPLPTAHTDDGSPPQTVGGPSESLDGLSGPMSIDEFCAIQSFSNTLAPVPLANDGVLTLDYLNEFDFDLQNNSQYTQPDDWQINFSPVVPRPLSPEHVSGNERLLMHYYSTTLVHLFPVLDSPKSPWKTVHLPRMFQGTGEMVVSGSTSQILAALRNTLLSVSAFYLSKHKRLQSRSDEELKWRREAMHYHGTGMTLLKDSVNTRSTCTVRPKYKEFLATMLSMISINVISGDIASCGLHLDAADRLITETAKWKRHYSNKAKALHRVYFYLRTIYESTAIRTNAETTIDGSGFVASPFAGFDDTERADAYESIYAIPKSLLIFLGKTTELINAVLEVRTKIGGTHIPSPLAERCDELESSIMDWQADETRPEVTSRLAANAGIIKNMTWAFHKAIIIFFAQHIRLLGHRYLKPYVEDVLDRIEAVERIKTEWQVQASPLYWPAFIAASETFDSRLHDRFRKWYAQVEPHAIGSMSPGIGLLEQVWMEGPSEVGRKTSLWRHIATRTNTPLMLT